MTSESKGLLDLPSEVIAHIFLSCDPQDISNASMTCKTLHEPATWESLWRSKAKRDYNICSLNVNNWTYRDVYQNLLYKYGYTLGLWQCNESCYGAVFKVEFHPEDASLRCHELRPPPSPQVKDKVRRKPLFVIRTVRPEESPSHVITCCCRRSEVHDGSLTKAGRLFVYRCLSLLERDALETLDFPEWLHEEYVGSDAVFHFGTQLLLRKFVAAVERERVFTASPFRYNSVRHVQDPVLIGPGVFKGTYSVHGLEFVHLAHESGEKMVVRKITGDENVPAGEVTVTVDLTRPMVLNRAQQNAESLLDIDIPDTEPGFDIKALPRQPFTVPSGFRERGIRAPDYCKARFHGQGQIAGTGFSNPTTSPGHWVLFDENTFGFLWLELESFGLYCRVKDEEL